MASMVKCDKCGKLDTNPRKFMHIRAYKMTNANEYNTNTEKYIDVCLECYEKIFKKEDKNNGN